MNERIKTVDRQPAINQQRSGDFMRDNHPGLMAERLSIPKDLDKIVRDADAGQLEVRDIGRYTENGRRAAMNAGRAIYYQGQSIDQALVGNREAIESMSRAGQQFRNVMTGDVPYAQPSAGWNFACNAEGFLDAGYPWAKHLDESLQNFFRESLNDSSRGGISELINMGAKSDAIIRQLWDEYATHDPLSIAWYLSERSLISENYQTDRYEKEMTESKQAVARQINHMSQQYNLPVEHHNRALSQLQRAKFSAFDHLMGGVDAGDGTLGDYITGTLRVETKLGGNTANPRDASDVIGTTTHELFHATSAQDVVGRIGLKAEGRGTDINEGMTELLNKLSLNRVLSIDGKIEFVDFCEGQPCKSRTYDTEVKSMYVIKRNYEASFETLFHAYYGHVPDKNKLRESIDLFNRYAEHIETQKHSS